MDRGSEGTHRAGGKFKGKTTKGTKYKGTVQTPGSSFILLGHLRLADVTVTWGMVNTVKFVREKNGAAKE
ncbi:hypothetical protein E2C01_067544 [Portunus trituberculatus]|uniref:Uncharacterized protein n=1 Tax=Portunus trituberculatus TaxID=210409 RepID=A0A5B7HPL1_PORTR|nr:hypothetical protein [Portunus trituberculatus]